MKTTDNLNAWRALAYAAKTGSLSQTAEHFGMELSKVSRLISGMENEMGFVFFDKSTRPYKATPKLKNFVAAFEPALRSLDNARGIYQTSGDAIHIRMAAPIEIARLYYSKVLVEYSKEHPNISFALQPDATLSSLRAGGVDAIVLPEPPASSDDLIVRLYHVTSTVALATPQYLMQYGVPERPEDLARHTGLLLKTVNIQPVTNLYKDGVASPVLQWQKIFMTHDQIVLKEMLLEHRGITIDLSLAHAADEIESGRIVSVLPGWEREPWRMCLVTLRDREDACPPLRIFADAIAKKTGEDWHTSTERGRQALAMQTRSVGSWREF